MNRTSFITLNKTRLFTAEQVCDIVDGERERVLEELCNNCNGDSCQNCVVDYAKESLRSEVE